MPVTVRVGAVHLGRDVVCVAAGGGPVPIRPVRVDGSYVTPAYLLADSSGRLHTAGAGKDQQGLGVAIDDVRDIIGHPQIVIAGATWPAELVFRARLYNSLAAMGEHLRGRPDVVALPYPDGWPEDKIDLYCDLVEQLDVVVEPIPESIALSGYVRALGLVRAPDRAQPAGVGATGVYSDGRTALIVAVHGDDQEPTESIELPLSREATASAQAADDAVLEVMAAARSIGADTATVLLAGNARFNEPLWHAFRNHLGHRFQHADHAIHALVLGASHLLLSESEGAEPESTGRHAEPPPQAPAQQQPPPAPAQPPHQPAPPPNQPQQGGYETAHRPPTAENTSPPPMTGVGEDTTVRVGPGDLRSGPAPDPGELNSRFTRPPSQPAERNPPPAGAGYQEHSGNQPEWGAHDAAGYAQHKGTLWNKMKGNLFAVAGALALASVAMPAQSEAQPVGPPAGLGYDQVACPLTPGISLGPVSDGTPASVAEAGQPQGVQSNCAGPEFDTLHFHMPGPPGVLDLGPPFDI